MRWFLVFPLLASLFLSSASLALTESDLPERLQARYTDLIAELRCVVCQNQSLAESSVPLAKDLRATVHDQLLEGKSDRQIKDYLVERYGEFVLYRPRLSLRTVFLWAVPPLLLIVGLFAILGARRRGKPSALNDSEQQRLAALLNSNQPSSNRTD